MKIIFLLCVVIWVFKGVGVDETCKQLKHEKQIIMKNYVRLAAGPHPQMHEPTNKVIYIYTDIWN